jgi:hypothetical protein
VAAGAVMVPGACDCIALERLQLLPDIIRASMQIRRQRKLEWELAEFEAWLGHPREAVVVLNQRGAIRFATPFQWRHRDGASHLAVAGGSNLFFGSVGRGMALTYEAKENSPWQANVDQTGKGHQVR